MTAETIAKALGGHRAGATWMARCPVHDDRAPSLSISSSGKDGKVLVRCHAGCEQRDVITALVDRGLWDATGKSAGRFAPKRRTRIAAEPDPDAKVRTEAALAIWQVIATGRRAQDISTRSRTGDRSLEPASTSRGGRSGFENQGQGSQRFRRADRGHNRIDR
jgi:hypothetical protein